MPQTRKKIVVWTLLAAALVAAGIGAAIVFGGLYNVSANRPHSQPVYDILVRALEASVRLRARSVATPPLGDAAQLQRGALCYAQHCLQCHGGVGTAPQGFAHAMQPLPGPLVNATQRWQANELFWITRNGIRMSGMPAWEMRMSEQDIWAVVAFVQTMPTLTTTEFQAITQWQVQDAKREPSQLCRPEPPGAATYTPSVERGRRAMYQHACLGCHEVPGLTQSPVHIGPSLDGMARRQRIAGVLDNTPDNMAQWLLHTQRIKPNSAMPTMDMTEPTARDMAAFLESLR